MRGWLVRDDLAQARAMIGSESVRAAQEPLEEPCLPSKFLLLEMLILDRDGLGGVGLPRPWRASADAMAGSKRLDQTEPWQTLLVPLGDE